MTDEEMAKDYANTVKCEWENDTCWVDCKDEIEEAYLAGLKAGEKRGFEKGVKAKVNTTTISDYPTKTVWHKVANGDLPPIYTTVLDGNGDRVELDEHGKWQTYSEYYERYEKIDPPKAWCEIPRFEE